MTTQHERDDETAAPERSRRHRGARFYDCEVGRFLSVDPLATIYPSLNAFSYVGGMVSRAVDPDGRDIVILTHAARNDDPHAFHAVGHQAVLIGNDKEGWTFYSYDSDHSDSSNGNDNFARGAHFNSISEFANSEYNTFKDDYDDGQGKNTSHTNYAGGIIQRFEEGYRISTTEEQDAAMNKAAFEVFDTEYSISKGHQCTTVPEKALQAAGLNDGEDNYAGNNTKWDGIFDENIFPISKHHAIERLNKRQEIDDSLKLLK